MISGGYTPLLLLTNQAAPSFNGYFLMLKVEFVDNDYLAGKIHA
jgi:hypothetical protein